MLVIRLVANINGFQHPQRLYRHAMPVNNLDLYLSEAGRQVIRETMTNELIGCPEIGIAFLITPSKNGLRTRPGILSTLLPF